MTMLRFISSSINLPATARRRLFQFAIKMRPICSEVGACLQAIQLVAHRLQAGSYKTPASHLESELELP